MTPWWPFAPKPDVPSEELRSLIKRIPLTARYASPERERLYELAQGLLAKKTVEGAAGFGIERLACAEILRKQRLVKPGRQQPLPFGRLRWRHPTLDFPAGSL